MCNFQISMNNRSFFLRPYNKMSHIRQNYSFQFTRVIKKKNNQKELLTEPKTSHILKTKLILSKKNCCLKK